MVCYPLVAEDFPCWSTPPIGAFKLNSNVACLDGEVGIGVIVRDMNGDVLLAFGSYFAMTRTVELVEVIGMFNGISKAIEAVVASLWVESDSKILWNFLVGNCRLQMRFIILSMLVKISIFMVLSMVSFGPIIGVILLCMI